MAGPRDALTGQTYSFCGMADRLKGFDLYHVMDQYFCFSYEAALAKRAYGGKLIVSQWENIPHHNEENFMERHIKATVQKQADFFLAMSDLSKQALLKEGVPNRRSVTCGEAWKLSIFLQGPRIRNYGKD